jgi:hypothetical protein
LCLTAHLADNYVQSGTSRGLNKNQIIVMAFHKDASCIGTEQQDN